MCGPGLPSGGRRLFSLSPGLSALATLLHQRLDPGHPQGAGPRVGLAERLAVFLEETVHARGTHDIPSFPAMTDVPLSMSALWGSFQYGSLVGL